MKNIIYIFSFLAFACTIPSGQKMPEEYSKSVEIKGLFNLKNTVRISSNHYSDFVIDENGNSYIASFGPGEEGRDQIYIVKVSENGAKLWEIGNGSTGRATAISQDLVGTIWVTGIFEGTIAFENPFGGIEKITTFSGKEGFLANFDSNGKCLKLISSKGGAFPVNCGVNKNGVVLIHGNAGKNLSFGFQSLIKKEKNENFFAAFDESGGCLWVKSTNARVSKIISDDEGNFYCIGSFAGAVNFDNKNLESTENEGFILKLNKKGETVFLKKIESENSILGVGNVLLTNDGNLVLTSVRKIVSADYLAISSNTEIEELILIELDKNGKSLSEKNIIQNLPPRSVTTVNQMENGDYFVSCRSLSASKIQGNDYFFDAKSQVLILRLNQNFEVETIIQPNNYLDGACRVGQAWKDKIFYTGHFRGEFSMGEFSAKSGVGHNLFLLKLETE